MWKSHHELGRKFVSALISTPQDQFFSKLMQKIDDHFDYMRADSMASMKKINKMKMKGDFFEYMCYRLFMVDAFPVLKVKEVWLFSELPLEKKKEFALGTKDMGIDLVAETQSGQWLAIQCKYRKRPRCSTRPDGKPIYWKVKWQDLSTFFSLCERTGPSVNRQGRKGARGWYKHVVMTNAPSVNRQGRKGNKDFFY